MRIHVRFKFRIAVRWLRLFAFVGEDPVMKHLLLAAIFVLLLCAGFAVASTPEYSIQAIRYASADDDAADLVMGAPHEKINLAMVVWLIRGEGRNILFDS